MGPTYGEAQNYPFPQNQTPAQPVGGTTVPTPEAQAPAPVYNIPRPEVQPPGVQYDGAGNVIRPAPTSGTPGTPANTEVGRSLGMPGYEKFRIDAGGNLLQAPEPVTVTTMSPAMAGSYQATVNKVSHDALVRQQLEGLIAQGSRYLDQARQQAAQTANKRGILNSSFAAGAGERAAISQALPIAMQDAGTFNQRELAAMDAINQANQFNAEQTTQTSIANSGYNNQMSQFNASQANSMAQAQWSQLAQQQHDAAMKSLDDAGRAQLIAIEAQARRLIEADTNYSRVFESAMNSLGDVLGNTNLSADQQRAAQTTILGQLTSFQSFYNLLQNGGQQSAAGQQQALAGTPIPAFQFNYSHPLVYQ